MEFKEIQNHPKCKPYKNYMPTDIIITEFNKIYVIGDIHGNYEFLVNSLLKLNLIKLENPDDISDITKIKWTGGDTIVVQMGDQLDSCRPMNSHNVKIECANVKAKYPDILILKLCSELHSQAMKQNGQFISLLGNHELLNIMGKMEYVDGTSLAYFNNYKNSSGLKFQNPTEARKYAFHSGNEYANLLACTRLPYVIIDDYLFIHAGLLLDFAKKIGLTNKQRLYDISYLITQFLLNELDAKNKKLIKLILNSSESFFWCRFLGMLDADLDENNIKCSDLRELFEISFFKKMIIAHTPQILHNNPANSTCGNKLFRVDEGKWNEPINFSGHMSSKVLVIEKINGVSSEHFITL